MAGLEEPNNPKEKAHSAGTVAIILACGVVAGMLVITTAILIAAWARLGVDPDSGISENGTQLLTAIFSGVISALSVYLGINIKDRLDRKNGIVPPKPPEEKNDNP